MHRSKFSIGVRESLICTAIMLTGAASQDSFSEDLRVRVLSSRPDVVSGDDALVGVTGIPPSGWSVRLNGRDVTDEFRPAAGLSSLAVARLTQLKLGKNVLEVRSGGRVRQKLELQNYPRVGPIFAGPHQQPFVCQTQENGLGTAKDANCSADVVVEYYYKSTDPLPPASGNGARDRMAPGFKPYPVSGAPPADVADTQTSDGRSVKFIVRRELGTINRGVYDIQFLHEPGSPLPNPWTERTSGWNGRLVFALGAGCAAGYRQGVLYNKLDPRSEQLLAAGYAIATSTLTAFFINCSDRIAAETLSMVKEYFIETYGSPVHTIGTGGSGGAIQAHLLAQNYPGLVDGIVVYGSYPDIVTTFQSSHDCMLLDRFFSTSQRPWREEQKSAVSGFATWRTCAVWLMERWVKPSDCESSIPKELVYDRQRNPQGARCTIYDNEINVFGRDPQTGFARRPLDNVGVQYGLSAFQEGVIDAEQFIELNESIGGLDVDGEIIAARTQADAQTLRIAYQTGLVVSGAGGLGQIPIIDSHSYADDLGDQHDLVRSFMTRARLIASNGQADNQVILVRPRPGVLGRTAAGNAEHLELIRQMDQWLGKLAADPSTDPIARKMSRNRPQDLADACWAISGRKIVEPAQYHGSGQCSQIYPAYSHPRAAAGSPLADDILKCALKPVAASDYSRPLTPEQLKRLERAFPQGVCDYSKPGIGQQPFESTWQRH